MNGMQRDLNAERAIAESRELLRKLRAQLTELDVFTARTEQLSGGDPDERE